MPDTDFHPELRRMGRFLPKQNVSPKTLPPFRFHNRRLARRTPTDVEVASLRPASPCGALGPPHGGGYVMGSAAQADKSCPTFARRRGAVAAAVEYRLAPEHPFPAALDDCYMALAWLSELPYIDVARVFFDSQCAMLRRVFAPQ